MAEILQLKKERADLVYSLLRKLYPHYNPEGGSPVARCSLSEVLLTDQYSEVAPADVDLSTNCGPVKLNLPLISAAMDTVSGPDLGKALFELGGCGILWRQNKITKQMDCLRQVLDYKHPFLVDKPESLGPEDNLADADEILGRRHSTIPVAHDGKLLGIFFTKHAALKEHLSEPVKDWMVPLADLKIASPETPFAEVRYRLLSEKDCSVLPIVGSDGKFYGMYFRKDCRPANPIYHNNLPLAGVAVGVSAEDCERARVVLEMGAGIIVIDSSHGDCPTVIEQARQIVIMAESFSAAVIAGNVASIDGYLRLAEVGAHAVKVGIGSGSICTTSSVTGVGVPMWSLIRECAYARQYLLKKELHAPAIIADGGVNTSGDVVKALAAGAGLCMAGQFFAAAKESIAAMKDNCAVGDMVYYRGMASSGAIAARNSSRYGKGKRAPEGVEGGVVCRGSLKTWIEYEIELIQGGLAHIGARNIAEAQEIANRPFAWSQITWGGQNQVAVRVMPY